MSMYVSPTGPFPDYSDATFQYMGFTARAQFWVPNVGAQVRLALLSQGVIGSPNNYTAVDPEFGKVQLLLHLSGKQGEKNVTDVIKHIPAGINGVQFIPEGPLVGKAHSMYFDGAPGSGIEVSTNKYDNSPSSFSLHQDVPEIIRSSHVDWCFEAYIGNVVSSVQEAIFRVAAISEEALAELAASHEKAAAISRALTKYNSTYEGLQSTRDAAVATRDAAVVIALAVKNLTTLDQTDYAGVYTSAVAAAFATRTYDLAAADSVDISDLEATRDTSIQSAAAAYDAFLTDPQNAAAYDAWIADPQVSNSATFAYEGYTQKVAAANYAFIAARNNRVGSLIAAAEAAYNSSEQAALTALQQSNAARDARNVATQASASEAYSNTLAALSEVLETAHIAYTNADTLAKGERDGEIEAASSAYAGAVGASTFDVIYERLCTPYTVPYMFEHGGYIAANVRKGDPIAGVAPGIDWGISISRGKVKVELGSSEYEFMVPDVLIESVNWLFLRVTRHSDTLKCWLGEQLLGTFTYAATTEKQAHTYFRIGRGFGPQAFKGYIDEIRFTIGSARVIDDGHPLRYYYPHTGDDRLRPRLEFVASSSVISTSSDVDSGTAETVPFLLYLTSITAPGVHFDTHLSYGSTIQIGVPKPSLIMHMLGSAGEISDIAIGVPPASLVVDIRTYIAAESAVPISIPPPRVGFTGSPVQYSDILVRVPPPRFQLGCSNIFNPTGAVLMQFSPSLDMRVSLGVSAALVIEAPQYKISAGISIGIPVAKIDIAMHSSGPVSMSIAGAVPICVCNLTLAEATSIEVKLPLVVMSVNIESPAQTSHAVVSLEGSITKPTIYMRLSEAPAVKISPLDIGVIGIGEFIRPALFMAATEKIAVVPPVGLSISGGLPFLSGAITVSATPDILIWIDIGIPEPTFGVGITSLQYNDAQVTVPIRVPLVAVSTSINTSLPSQLSMRPVDIPVFGIQIIGEIQVAGQVDASPSQIIMQPIGVGYVGIKSIVLRQSIDRPAVGRDINIVLEVVPPTVKIPHICTEPVVVSGGIILMGMVQVPAVEVSLFTISGFDCRVAIPLPRVRCSLVG